MDLSNVEWTKWTFNGWKGCRHCSAGCDFCYADREMTMHKMDFSKVTRTTPANWRKPYKWAKTVANDAPLTERLVFTCSWSDVFISDADEWRADFWKLIRENPNLVFQILTKRIGRVKNCLPPDWGDGYPNVWLGVSVEDQKTANARIPLLNSIPATVKFISFEPLIGGVDLHQVKGMGWSNKDEHGSNFWNWTPMFDWAILGGESGNNKGDFRFRPCEADWLDFLADSLVDMNVPFFVKQMGTHLSKEMGLKDRHGRNIDEFPKHLQVREFPFDLYATVKNPASFFDMGEKETTVLSPNAVYPINRFDHEDVYLVHPNTGSSKKYGFDKSDLNIIYPVSL